MREATARVSVANALRRVVPKFDSDPDFRSSYGSKLLISEIFTRDTRFELWRVDALRRGYFWLVALQNCPSMTSPLRSRKMGSCSFDRPATGRDRCGRAIARQPVARASGWPRRLGRRARISWLQTSAPPAFR